MGEEDFEIKYVTRDEALEIARSQTVRDLTESESSISYVGFVPGVEDFCVCEFRYEAPHGWVQSCRVLREDERRPGEEITDAHIADVARSGNLISAIRLYRAKYGVGLAEGKAAVTGLLST